MLWGAIKCRLCHYERFPTTYHELQSAIEREWESFDQSSIDELILSFRERLIMCKNVGGKSISHFISAHLTEVPEDYIVAEADRPPIFTREEDIELMKEFNDGNCKR